MRPLDLTVVTDYIDVVANAGMLNDLVSSVVVFLHPLPCLVFAHSNYIMALNRYLKSSG